MTVVRLGPCAMSPFPVWSAMSLSSEDRAVLARLEAGDESAFLELVHRHQATMVRVAMRYCRSRDVAEEVVQDTWMGFLDSLERFEGRSSLKTWLYRILVNRSITRGKRERRSVPLSALGSKSDDPVVDPSRFAKDGSWANPPLSWQSAPDRPADDAEIRAQVTSAIGQLPERQALVMTLRDVQGLETPEICELLDITPNNMRVLLHRARAGVRNLLEDYYRGVPS